jgi:hypothetical protein
MLFKINVNLAYKSLYYLVFLLSKFNNINMNDYKELNLYKNIKSDNYKKSVQNVIEKIAKSSITLEIAQQFNEYTLHDIHHFNQVATNASKISKTQSLSEDESYILLCACYCHDLGMSYTGAQINQAQYNKNIIRKFHATYSKTLIQTEFVDQIEDETHRDIIGIVSEGHGRWDWENKIFDDQEEIRVRLLVFILSFADVLDLRSERRSPLNIKSADEFIKLELNLISKAHWLKHYYSIMPLINVEGNKIYLKLQARIGTNSPDNNLTTCDPRYTLIQEMVQSEVINVIEHPTFRKYSNQFCSINIDEPELNNFNKVHIIYDMSKFYIPKEFVHPVINYLIHSKTINIESKASYYLAKIDSFITEDDIQFSYNIRPQSFLPMKLKRNIGTKNSSKLDIIFINPDKYFNTIKVKSENGYKQKYIAVKNEIIKILNHESNRMYVLVSENEFPTPVTATKFIAKTAIKGSELKGRIEIKNSHQLNVYEHFIKKFESITKRKFDENISNDFEYRRIISIIPLYIILDLLKSKIHSIKSPEFESNINEIGAEAIYNKKVFDSLQKGKIKIKKFEKNHLEELRILEKYNNKAPWKFHNKSTKILFNDSNYNIILLKKNVIIGYLFAKIHSDYIEVRNMMIHPFLRRCGYASNLMEEVKNKIKISCFMLENPIRKRLNYTKNSDLYLTGK